MVPLSIQVPASVVLLAGGAIACFGGYRLFRLVLGVYGFILGALIGSSMAGAAETWMVLAGAAAGGVIGALALVAGVLRRSRAGWRGPGSPGCQPPLEAVRR